MHGLLVWGLATLLTAFMALAVVQMTPRLAAPSGAGAGPSASVAGENIIAFDLDRLFRGDRRPAGDMNMVRAEAARILMTTSSHRGMLAEDRAYLVRLVSANTGLSAADADRRVTEVAATAKDNISRARRAAAILAFMVAAAALVGAAAAWFAACAGGLHRDGLETVPDLWSWDRSYWRA
jgi:ribosomal protein L17